MIAYVDNRNSKICELLSVLKLFFMLFAAIAFFQYTFEEQLFLDLIQNGANVLLLLALGCGVMYAGWLFLISKKPADSPLVKWGSLAIMLLLSTCCVWMTGIQDSNYEFLYLMAVIIATIEYGKREGILLSLASSALILVTDLIMIRDVVINDSFEDDIVLCSVFVIIAYTLGYYVECEKNHINRLEHLVHMDALTELFNYRYFRDMLTHQVGVSASQGTSLALILIDIDHFKQYNDMFGHQMGDTVLQQLGILLKKEAGASYTAARYGGASFSLLMPDTGERGALDKAEKIRHDFEQLHIDREEYLPGGKLTISLGVSVFPENASSEVQLFDSADEALYRAKFLQRNRVESYYSILDAVQRSLHGEHRDTVASIKTLIAVINSRDNYTFTHVERVVTYCKLYAEATHMNEDDKQTLVYGAYMHDIGKINIDQGLLMKTGKLSDEEWEVLKRHPVDGAKVIQNIDSLQAVLPLILQHHERYDGSGYPYGLSGSGINFLARILSVADSFDAMTSNRPYQPRKTYEEAYEELRRCAGSQFDPEIAISFINIIQNYLLHSPVIPSAPERIQDLEPKTERKG